MNLGVAQLVARYLGVVEAASSSLVTQTKNTLKTLGFQGIFLCPVTQFFANCYTNCYATEGQLPTTDDLSVRRKTDPLEIGFSFHDSDPPFTGFHLILL